MRKVNEMLQNKIKHYACPGEPIDCPDCGNPEATYDDAVVHCSGCDNKKPEHRDNCVGSINYVYENVTNYGEKGIRIHEGIIKRVFL